MLAANGTPRAMRLSSLFYLPNESTFKFFYVTRVLDLANHLAITQQTQKPAKELSGVVYRHGIFFVSQSPFCSGSDIAIMIPMPLKWTTDPLAEGLRCYRNREFFDAHEHWESVWLQCEEPEKTFLQALIQITAAFHHLGRGNYAGTASLLRRALARLDGFPAQYEEVAVDALRAEVRGWLEALDQNMTGLPFPLIR
jgi:hypothetical protein